MISINNLTVEFGGFTLFKQVSFIVNTRDRIGLVGKNGAGKSTLLKIFAGFQAPTTGTVSLPNEIKIGYLPQQVNHIDGNTVMEEALSAFEEVLGLEKEIAEINSEIAERTDYESEEYMKLIERLTDKNDRYHMMGGENIEAEAERTLLGLGFLRSDFIRQTTEFSGGWRMRVELAKILLRRPHVFLLDEPTNHLDIESIQWLEDFLKTYPGAVVLVSHDRAFLDNITNRTVEISVGKIYDYKVPYSQYVVLHAERREQQMKAYINQQKQIKDTEDFIERFRYKATKSVQVQSRIKQLDKIDRIEIDEEDSSKLSLKFPPAPRSGDLVCEVKNLSKAYGDHLVLNELEFVIERGEKLAFVGKNGEGKSTLVKVLMGELEHTGTCKLGHNVKIGYFAQNQAQMLNENKSVFETIDDVAVGDVRTKIRDILGAFMFRGEDIDKKVKVLSGGERSRLAMIRLLLEPVNLLVLDEPTNHLDMRSKDVLKEALNQFDGTVIVVSHDREFLNGLSSKVYEFTNKKIKEHLGGIYDFLQTKKMDSLKELEVKKAVSVVQADAAPSDNKLNYLERKEMNKKISKMERAVSNSEDNIARFEEQIAQMEELLANPENMQDQSLFSRYEKAKKDLEKEMSDWENLNEELELLIAEKGE
ncbi:ATP-binding cassette domain-containing protein [Labilibaculum sp. A4]|uniref:ABC-F family ATP-binding cassette domain-containing protein n=1 Tax=Labilibaculum euxinus TaxID=2686357 RepID=UPI000F621A1E|nr:ABC-F family ATP-binding cassette domain-containing protein [Labilibaculum euxinus]MDQ1771290.1 ABC-F family ATP-binding cassette domain-containing protein [Labilibaculum euxinus]MWN77077.1 ATP-binding cassette domain-containing protein [Labilibaculum euxinus]